MNINESAYKIGDVISFSIDNSYPQLKGEIRNIYIWKEKTFIKIYTFFDRKDRLYILSDDGNFILPKRKRKALSDKNEPILYDLHDNYEDNIGLKIFIMRVIAVVIILVFLFADILINVRMPFLYGNLNYRDFLNKSYSVSKTFNIVKSRILYRYDMKEKWSLPEDAWYKRFGDCEEYAAIFAEYLTVKNIENYIVGLNIKNSRIGHAVVFFKKNNTYTIADLTGAVETAGLKEIPNARNLRDAIKYYSTLPVSVYDIPKFNGDKNILGYIY